MSDLAIVPLPEHFVDDYLRLEFEVAWPYRRFVFRDRDAASNVQRALFERGACEYAAPYAAVAVLDGRVAGMFAALAGAELRRQRMKEALAVARLDTVRSDPGMSRRAQRAAAVMPAAPDDALYLSRIAVEATCRRRGVGRMLLDHVLDRGLTLALSRCVLDVEAANAAAIELYSSRGFRRDGEHSATDDETSTQLRYVRMTAPLSRRPI